MFAAAVSCLLERRAAYRSQQISVTPFNNPPS
jgi:hypothetical protein